MSVVATFGFNLVAEETLELTLDCSVDPIISEDIGGPPGTISSGTTPPAKTNFCDDRQLAAGTDSIDLTALVRTGLANIDMTNQRLQIIKIFTDASNSDFITIKPDAINGYDLFGPSNEVDIPAGAAQMFFGNNLLPLVASGEKAITIVSTDADAKYKIQLIGG